MYAAQRLPVEAFSDDMALKTSPKNRSHRNFRVVMILVVALKALPLSFAVFPAVAQVSNALEYFPLQSGNEWTYLQNGSVFITQTVLGDTVSVNGVATKAAEGSDTLVSYYTNDSNGVRRHRQLLPGVNFGDGVLRDFQLTYCRARQIIKGLQGPASRNALAGGSLH